MQAVFGKFRDGVSRVNVPFTGGKSMGDVLGIDPPPNLQKEEEAVEEHVHEKKTDDNQAFLKKLMDYARELYLHRNLTGRIFLSIQVTVVTQGISVDITQKDLDEYKAQDSLYENYEPGVDVEPVEKESEESEHQQLSRGYQLIDKCMQLMAKSAIPWKNSAYDVTLTSQLSMTTFFFGCTACLETSANSMNAWIEHTEQKRKKLLNSPEQKSWK